MVPVRKSQNWLPDIFNDFFDNTWMEKANAKIDNNNQLVVSMEKKNEQEEGKKNGRYLRREFSYSKFQQAMILPDDVEKDKIQAKVEHGVLTIDLPKQVATPEEKEGRNIEIQ